MTPSQKSDKKEVIDDDSETQKKSIPAIFRRTSTLNPPSFSPTKKKFQRLVNFCPQAPISDCFKSVLKVYRIMKPDTIILDNNGLEDYHLIDLLEFLADK